MTNRVVLTAQIVERGALRFTPAGLPAIDMSLKHESTAEQLGKPRKLAFELRALGIGGVTEALLAAEMGREHRFEGFLGAQRNGRGIVFHIQTIAPSTN